MPVNNNPYDVNKSHDKKHRQDIFMPNMQSDAKKKASTHPKSKKPKLTTAQVDEKIKNGREKSTQ